MGDASWLAFQGNIWVTTIHFIGFTITNVVNTNYNAISKMYGVDPNAPLEG
jgi:hypothetical protein